MKDSNGQDLQPNDTVRIYATVVVDGGESIQIELPDETLLNVSYKVLSKVQKPGEPPKPGLDEP